MPQISVIVPVYKVETFLRRCVSSILGQTFTDYELILVDDGSPDNCPTICDQYATQDSRVVVIHQQNGGLSAARNAGIHWAFANSDSQWLTFIDSDDWVHPEMLERLLNAAVENDVTVSVCGYAETDGEELEIAEQDIIPRLWSPEDFFVECNVNATVAWGKLYRKECFASIRYPVGKVHEDEFVTYRLLFEANKIAVIDAPLYSYYINTEGITKSAWNPRRLVSIEAIAEQVRYMKENRHNDGYRYATTKYIKFLGYHLTSLKKCDTAVQKEHMPQLRLKLKKALLDHWRTIPFTGNEWLYELAFPRLMQIYWTGKAQLDKLRHKK